MDERKTAASEPWLILTFLLPNRAKVVMGAVTTVKTDKLVEDLEGRKSQDCKGKQRQPRQMLSCASVRQLPFLSFHRSIFSTPSHFPSEQCSYNTAVPIALCENTQTFTTGDFLIYSIK